MKFYYTLFLVLLSTLFVQAQMEVPIQSNPVIQQHFAELDRQYPKNLQYNRIVPIGQEKNGDCNLERLGVTYLEAGQLALLDIEIDTFGLGNEGTYECLNCADLQFGTGTVTGDTLVYASNLGVNSGQEFVTVEYCLPGGECPNSQTFEVIVKRQGTNFFPPIVNVEAGDRISVSANLDQFEGPIACNRFTECPDNYPGREQLAYFSTYNRPDNEVIYDAARYSGIDSVCVVLCDTFVICDTFHFSFRVRQDTLDELPILDDFSLGGPYPIDGFWLDREVFINDQFGIAAPSIGVATFDGIDYRGNAYPDDQETSDRLTSTYINLSNQPGDLYLYFWYQRKGNGDRPEPADSLSLQFKRSSGTWETMQVFEGSPFTQPNSFIDTFKRVEQIISDEFKHEGFQFRFQAYSDNKGIQDTWNIDYVHIEVIRRPFFPDISFSTPPLPIIAPYSSMPWNHFDTSLLNTTLEIQLFNQFSSPLNLNQQGATILDIEEITSPTPLFEAEQNLLNGTLVNIDNLVPVKYFIDFENDNSFSDNRESFFDIISSNAFDDLARPSFRTSYNIDTDQISGYINVLTNDFTEYTTVFDNYFAYDLGIAESGISLQENWELAVKYTTSVPDSLQALQFHFPITTTNIEDQQIHLKVWIGELDDTPEYEQLFLTPSYTSSFYDTLQGFTTYPLVDENGNVAPIELPAGDFYVGWEQVTACSGTNCVAVGLDKNRPQGADFIFRNLGSGWGPYPEFLTRGALMIRPVVGNERQGFTNVSELDQADSPIKVYPNPVRDQLFIELEDGALFGDFEYEMYDGLGQRLLSGQLERQIDVSKMPAGMYVLRIVDWSSNQMYSQRVIILE